MGDAGLIYQQMPKITAEVGAVEKSRRNQQQGYQFRSIDDLYAALQGLLATHGVTVVPQVLEYKREERASKSGGVLVSTLASVKHTFYASDGSSVEAITLGEGMDSGDKSANKAMSGAMKYALIECFCIPTWDPDDDSEHSSPQPAHHAPQTSAPPPTRQTATPTQTTDSSGLVKQTPKDSAAALILDQIAKATTTEQLTALVPKIKGQPESVRNAVRAVYDAQRETLGHAEKRIER